MLQQQIHAQTCKYFNAETVIHTFFKNICCEKILKAQPQQQNCRAKEPQAANLSKIHLRVAAQKLEQDYTESHVAIMCPHIYIYLLK